MKKTIHWITALLLRMGSTYLMLIGLLFGLTLQYILPFESLRQYPHYYPYSWLFVTLGFMTFTSEAGENFYGDKYREYMAKYGAGKLSIPLKDYWFYETQLSAIPINRKVSGYIYAVGIIWINVNFGLIFGYTGWQLLKQNYPEVMSLFGF